MEDPFDSYKLRYRSFDGFLLPSAFLIWVRISETPPFRKTQFPVHLLVIDFVLNAASSRDKASLIEKATYQPASAAVFIDKGSILCRTASSNEPRAVI